MGFIGCSERAVELMLDRVHKRVAFGKPLVEQGTIQKDIALSRIELEQARLLTLKAAHMMDKVGNKVAAPEIAMIKVVAPKMCHNVVDRAIQAHGGAGLNSDLPLAGFFGWARALRFAERSAGSMTDQKRSKILRTKEHIRTIPIRYFSFARIVRM